MQFIVLFSGISSTSADEDDEEIDAEELSSPFECGVCRIKFRSAQKLESHVNKSHKKQQKDSPTQKLGENSTQKSILVTVIFLILAI